MTGLNAIANMFAIQWATVISFPFLDCVNVQPSTSLLPFGVSRICV